MNGIIDLVAGTFGNAVGFMSDSIGELYWFMASWVIIAFIFSMIASPSRLGAVAMVIPIPTILLMFVVAFFIENWIDLVNWFADMMVSTGASSSPATAHIDFKDPNAILGVGWDVSLPARKIMNDLGWTFNFFDKLMALGAVILIMTAYGAVAIIIVFAYIAYYVISFIAAFLLPLAIFNRTAWLAEGALKYVAGTGVVLMAIALIAGVMGNVVADLNWGDSMLNLEMFKNNAVITVMLVVVVATPKIAAKVVGTGSVFGVGDAVRGLVMASSVARMAGMLGGTMGIAGGGGGASSAASGASASSSSGSFNADSGVKQISSPSGFQTGEWVKF